MEERQRALEEEKKMTVEQLVTLSSTIHTIHTTYMHTYMHTPPHRQGTLARSLNPVVQLVYRTVCMYIQTEDPGRDGQTAGV